MVAVEPGREELDGIGRNGGQRVHSATHINWFEIDAILGKNPVLMTDRNDTGVDGDRAQSNANLFLRLGMALIRNQ